ncbi:MAG TPA: hypothetical protein VGQ73_09945, partial [Gemmatimonadales bacterium]|nr:hypothetical protein [Gemmatimonadales bacterium]
MAALPPHDAASKVRSSRRDFLLRAGQFGCALSVLPQLRGRWLGPRQAPQQEAELYSGLRWRLLGPFRGGRVAAVSGVPGRPNEFYFGSVNGGVWKSVDA